MTDSRVTDLRQLGAEQCGNQTAYGLPWSLYCSNYKGAGQEWCPSCCRDIRENYPGTDTSRRNLPVEMLTLFTPSGHVFVWPRRGGETEEQQGQIFVFDRVSHWGKQVAHGPESLRDVSNELQEHWGDFVSVYAHEEFKELLGGLDGISYHMDTLRRFAEVYGAPVPDRT